MKNENEMDENDTGYVKISIALDKDYYFREIPYNYVIAKRVIGKRDGEDCVNYISECYYPNALGAINYYIAHCHNKKQPTETVDALKKEFSKRESNTKQLFEPIAKAKREYELQNELLKTDNESLREQLEGLTLRYNNVKAELKLLKGAK